MQHPSNLIFRILNIYCCANEQNITQISFRLSSNINITLTNYMFAISHETYKINIFKTENISISNSRNYLDNEP